MAQSIKVVLQQDTWTQLTDADITSITAQNQSGYNIEIAGTTGAAPGPTDATIFLPPYGIFLNESLTDLHPGISAVRVWARGSGTVSFSHA